MSGTVCLGILRACAESSVEAHPDAGVPRGAGACCWRRHGARAARGDIGGGAEWSVHGAGGFGGRRASAGGADGAGAHEVPYRVDVGRHETVAVEWGDPGPHQATHRLEGRRRLERREVIERRARRHARTSRRAAPAAWPTTRSCPCRRRR